MAPAGRRIWVLCDVYDVASFWVAEQLMRRGREVSVATAAQLEAAVRVRQRIGCTGQATVDIELGDGRHLTDGDASGVLNRLSSVPFDRIHAIAGADRDYALQEMHSWFLSWLHALPGPMLNRPTTQGLGGNWRHPSAWAMLAGQAGLETPVYRESDEYESQATWAPVAEPGTVTVFFVAGTLVVTPDLPPDTRRACLELGALAGDALLGIDLLNRDGRWEFQGASPRPDLFRGGEPLVDALSQALL